jgi:adenylate cyclase class 2
MTQEIEVKFPLANREAFLRKLDGLGAKRLYPETFEDNIVLDKRGELKTRGCLLRVRKFGKYTIVTYKGPMSIASGVRSRDEVQTGIESFDRALALFDLLGYKPVFRYQKFREVWRVNNAEVVLDRTPIGDYFEIEGPLAMIREICGALGLEMGAAIRMNYAELYRQQRRTHGELPEHMVFPPEGFPTT